MHLESLARMTLGVNDQRVISVEGDLEGLTISLVRKQNRHLPCSVCGARSRVYDKLEERTWRHVPLWGIPTAIRYRPARVRCQKCGVKVEAMPWSSGKSPLSLPLIILLATWAKLLPVSQVAERYGVGWEAVRTAVQRAVEYGLEHRETDGVYALGIDEVSRKRGHVYHTQVYDLVERRLLWSKEGRKTETLEAFFDEWGEARTAGLSAICCDMWAPYIDTIRRRAPNALLVFDKFHLVKHLSQAVDQVRRNEVREKGKAHKELVAKTRYIWLKNPWNLTPKQKRRLGELERMNLQINRAYLLKEGFRDLWSYQRHGWARRFLDQWCWWATHSRLKPMRDFAYLVRRHLDGILNWFHSPIDNGAVEAMNNNAKVISHRARGYRTAEMFTTMMLHGMGHLPSPVYAHKFL